MISGLDIDVSLPISGHIVYADDAGRQIGFQAGLAGTALEHLRLGDFPSFAYDEEYEYSGGMLRLGKADLIDWEATHPKTGLPGRQRQLAGEWAGSSYALFTFPIVPLDSRFDLLDWFSSVEIEDSLDGVWTRPRPGLRLTAQQVALTKETPGLGLVKVYDRRLSSGEVVLPGWEGTRVAAGELFRTHLHSGDGDHVDVFVLATETAVVVAQPVDDTSTQERLERISVLDVEWQAA